MSSARHALSTHTACFCFYHDDNLTFAPVRSPGDAGAAEEERAVHRGSVSESVQQQEHEGYQRAAQQRPGGGHGGPAGRSARRAAQSTFPYTVYHIYILYITTVLQYLPHH